MTKLSAAQTDEKLRKLAGWRRKGNFITKDFEFEEFMKGIRFVNDIAGLAERLDHHPDIHIRWTSVRLEIQTHDEGGVTPLDIELATEIERHLRNTA
jgi:4a-hydroxytetrahydrobiopterin dehydratase